MSNKNRGTFGPSQGNFTQHQQTKTTRNALNAAQPSSTSLSPSRVDFPIPRKTLAQFQTGTLVSQLSHDNTKTLQPTPSSPQLNQNAKQQHKIRQSISNSQKLKYELQSWLTEQLQELKSEMNQELSKLKAQIAQLNSQNVQKVIQRPITQTAGNQRKVSDKKKIKSSGDESKPKEPIKPLGLRHLLQKQMSTSPVNLRQVSSKPDQLFNKNLMTTQTSKMLTMTQTSKKGDERASLDINSSESIGDERSPHRIVRHPQARQLAKESDRDSAQNIDEECDEKRYMTPQPRQKQTQQQKNQIGRLQNIHLTAQITHRNYGGIGQPGANLNKSTLSAINHKSDCMSDISDALSAYISPSKKHPLQKTSNFVLDTKNDEKSLDNSKISQYNYQELMAQKGSKCKCTSKNSLARCSTYCKRQGPNAQRKIIVQLLRSEQVRQMEKKEWQPVRYLISQRWWSQWCDFVNFDSKINLDNSFDFNFMPNPVKKSTKSDLENSQESDVSQLYEKPSRIQNSGLLAESCSSDRRQKLRNNLIEHFDYEVLLPLVWKHFYSWYSADFQIARKLKKDVLNRHIMVLDLYPEQSKAMTNRESNVFADEDDFQNQKAYMSQRSAFKYLF